MVAGDPLLFSSLSEFEWDTGNLTKNQLKHGVLPQECEEIFFNQPLVNKDEAHSNHEPRFHALGQTSSGRKLFVVFTVRNTKLRIISARDQSRKERIIYKETLDG